MILARNLRDRPDLDSALSAYEAIRRPRVERAVEQGRGGDGKASGPATRVLRDRIFFPIRAGNDRSRMPRPGNGIGRRHPG